MDELKFSFKPDRVNVFKHAFDSLRKTCSMEDLEAVVITYKELCHQEKNQPVKQEKSNDTQLPANG